MLQAESARLRTIPLDVIKEPKAYFLMKVPICASLLCRLRELGYVQFCPPEYQDTHFER